MTLSEPQALWIKDFTGRAAAKQSFDNEVALKQAIIKEVREKIAKEKIKLQEAITFEAGGRTTLDQDGSQRTEADSTEYGKAKLTWEQMMKVNNVAKLMQFLQDKMETPTIKRPNRNGVLVDEPLFNEREIADELFSPLVRERLLPETLVPSLYSETARMIEGSDKAYREDLEEYTKNLKEEEESLAASGMNGLAKLSDIGSKLAAAFPGSEAKMASDVLGLCSTGLSGVATGYEQIRKSEFKKAGVSIIDNVGVLLKGILSMVVSKDVAESVSLAYTAGASSAKLAIAIADGDPAEALSVLADGLDASMGIANKDNKDPVAGSIGSFISGQLRNSKNIEKVVVAIQKRDFEGVVDGFTSVAETSIKGCIGFAGSLEKIGKTEKQQAEIDKKFNEISSTSELALQGGNFAVKGGKAVADSIKAGSIQETAESLIASLGGLLSTSLTLAKVNPDSANMIGSIFTSASNGGLVIVELTKEKPNSSKIAELIGAALGAAVLQANPKDDSIKKASDYIEKAFASLAGGIEIVEAIKSGSPEKLKAATGKINTILKTVMEVAFGEVNEKDTEGKTEQEKKEILELRDKLKQELGQDLDSIAEGITNSLDSLNSEDSKKELMKSQEQEMAKRLAEKRNSLMEVLKKGKESSEFARDVTSINSLIAEMQRDAMIMQMAVSVAKGGIQMAAKWVPALGTVATAMELAENLMAAAERAQALNEWIKNEKDLKNAQDALESSAANFVKNQAEQFSHYSIQAAFNVAMLIGQVLELSGISSAAGTGLKAAAEAGAAIEEVIYEFYKKATVEAAWMLTQKALRNPKNRRLGLEARAINPTLAKYSIAWSAMVAENPMARNIMNEIGLSENTLRQKDADVKSVVKFIELKFSDDVQVRKKIDLKESYMPAPVELTSKCWNLAKTRAQNAPEQPLLPIATGKVDGLIADSNKKRELLKVALKDMTVTVEKAEEYMMMMDNLETELASVQKQMFIKGTSSKNEPHTAMQNFVDDMLERVTKDRIDARMIVAEAEEFEVGQSIEGLFA